jgi:hypothetical protein
MTTEKNGGLGTQIISNRQSLIFQICRREFKGWLAVPFV